jgi:uncharacterized protein (TIGR02996 family)
MSDEDALLAAIAEHPDEDTPRLVYADWLQEHDQPIRAEFIRVQIEIARKQETLPRVLLNRHVDLFKRQQELLDNHRDELLGQLAKLPVDVTRDFSRGFLSQIVLSVDAFLEHAPLIATTKPLPRVRVNQVSARLADFVLCPHLDCITQLQFYPDALVHNPPAWPDDEDMLDAGERLTRLEVLDLARCGINDLHLDLAFNYSLPALVELDLSNNLITDDGVSNLLATGWQRQLKRLILRGNPITDVGVRLLADRWPTDSPLEYLNLGFTNIGTSGQLALLARFGGKVELF